MERIQKMFGSFVLASALAAMPLVASAESVHAHSATGVFISPSGIVRVIGADVTAVGSGVVSAATTIGTTIINWLVNTSASTNITVGGSTSTSTSGIKIGDSIGFVGTLSSSTGSSFTVAASKLHDFTRVPPLHVVPGTIVSVNVGSSSLTISKGNRTLTVQTNASTTVSLNGTASTLASLQAGEKVRVVGTASADGSVITASQIVAKTKSGNDNEAEEENDKHASSISKESHHENSIFGRLHLHLGNDD